MTKPTATQIAAPVAPRRSHSFTTHGITVTDDYAWLKDANWQEVLRDPAILAPEIRTYLDAENTYTDGLLGHTGPLQKKLVAEMRGRIKEDNSSVPSPDGPFAYFRKYREGGQHELFCRQPRDGGDVHVGLDGDELAKAHDYFKFGGRAPFPRPQAHGLERRRQGLGIFRDPGARVGVGRGPRRCRGGDRRRRGLERRLCELLLRQARRQSSPDAGLAASAGNDTGGRRPGL